jgi:hypothetical protein
MAAGAPGAPAGVRAAVALPGEITMSPPLARRRRRAAPGQTRVDDLVVMVPERDLARPLLDLVAAVLDQADAE